MTMQWHKQLDKASRFFGRAEFAFFTGNILTRSQQCYRSCIPSLLRNQHWVFWDKHLPFFAPLGILLSHRIISLISAGTKASKIEPQSDTTFGIDQILILWRQCLNIHWLCLNKQLAEVSDAACEIAMNYLFIVLTYNESSSKHETFQIDRTQTPCMKWNSLTLKYSYDTGIQIRQ